jgi:hypothetical protein
MRTVGSTVAGQAVDIILVMVLAFGVIVSNSGLFHATFPGCAAKVLF